MTAEHYKDSKRLSISPQDQTAFDAGVQTIKSTMLAHGFSQQAVGQLQFSLRQYTLTIDVDEATYGAFHVYADGTPFYEIHISAPGVMMELIGTGGIKPTDLDDRKQSLNLFFEISANLFSRVGPWAQKKYGVDPDSVDEGSQTFPTLSEANAAFRCAPDLYISALNDLVEWRLEMIAPKSAVSASVNTKKNKGPSV